MIKVELVEIESSIASAVGYDINKRQMIVVYHGGNAYQYNKIDKVDYDSLFATISFGKKLKEIIKGKPYNKI